jgi:hypothetical protein
MSDDDEKFGEFLQGAARDYNAPPGEVPSAEMWEAIRAARRAGALSSGGAAPVVLPIGKHVHMKRRQLLVGLAATLLIGVALGRYVLGVRDAARPLASATSVENRAPVAPSASPAPVAPTAPAAPPASAFVRRGAGYDLAAGEHLARVEALLTAYHATKSDVVMDTSLARWAYDMVSNTRLLLDSPAARDPARRRLLEDLELVLVQLVQHSAGVGAADDRALVERSLERTQVLIRLRAAQVAGPNSGS